MKILLVGDSHGSESFARNVCAFADSADVDAIIQLGDFGYRFDDDFISQWTAWLDANPDKQVYWVDGNHDNHDYIEDVIMADERAWDVPVSHWHDRLFYCPRGSRKVFGDTSVLFVGGAFSIDKAHRQSHISWWPQETITYADAERSVQGGPVDVVLSHDCPNTVFFQEELENGYYKIDRDSQANRDALNAICDIVKPKHVYHGHYHTYYNTDDTANSGRVVHGLSANINHANRAVGFDNVEVVTF